MSDFTKGRDIITPFCLYSSVVGIWKSNRVWTGMTCFSFFESLVLPQNQVKLGLRLRAPESLEPYHSGKKTTQNKQKQPPRPDDDSHFKHRHPLGSLFTLRTGAGADSHGSPSRGKERTQSFPCGYLSPSCPDTAVHDLWR